MSIPHSHCTHHRPNLHSLAEVKSMIDRRQTRASPKEKNAINSQTVRVGRSLANLGSIRFDRLSSFGFPIWRQFSCEIWSDACMNDTRVTQFSRSTRKWCFLMCLKKLCAITVQYMIEENQPSGSEAQLVAGFLESWNFPLSFLFDGGSGEANPVLWKRMLQENAWHIIHRA